MKNQDLHVVLNDVIITVLREYSYDETAFRNLLDRIAELRSLKKEWILEWVRENFTVEGVLTQQMTDPDDVEIIWA